MTSFTSLLVAPLDSNAASKKNYWDSCSIKKVLLKISQNLRENTCAQVLFFNKVACLKPATLLKYEIPVQLFSYEFWEFFKNTFSIEHARPAAYGLNVLAKI